MNAYRVTKPVSIEQTRLDHLKGEATAMWRRLKAKGFSTTWVTCWNVVKSREARGLRVA